MSNRTKALDWWKSLSKSGKEKAVEEWKVIPSIITDYRKTWPMKLIEHSTSTIENIWQETQKVK